MHKIKESFCEHMNCKTGSKITDILQSRFNMMAEA